MKRLIPHPLASLFPRMAPAAYAELRDSTDTGEHDLAEASCATFRRWRAGATCMSRELGNDSQFRLTLDETKPRGGRPPNKLIPRLMEKDGVSRATVYRRLKAKHEAHLAKLARAGVGRDRQNEHPDGFYPTPPRGTRALLSVENFSGVIWEPACGDGAISRILEAAGHEVISTDLVDRNYGRGGHDFLADHTTRADHIITNPPFALSRQFVEHALSRIPTHGTVCMLLRANWEAAQSRRHLMACCCRKWTFSRRLEMRRGGYSGKRAGSQMDTAWFVFRLQHTGPTLTRVLEPNCGEALPLLTDLAAD
jgi:hypothetical protein